MERCVFVLVQTSLDVCECVRARARASARVCVVLDSLSLSARLPTSLACHLISQIVCCISAAPNEQYNQCQLNYVLIMKPIISRSLLGKYTLVHVFTMFNLANGIFLFLGLRICLFVPKTTNVYRNHVNITP